ncbi:hypothetical protein BGW37DRAFT_473764 [Umbelopsis sp. PMI_123]|nr:hypothetical protein BGW37DRAFT_473764 [Umbelopsis sp. PMI_123]
MTQISEDASHNLAKGLTDQIVPTLDILDRRLSILESQQQDLLDSVQSASDSTLTEPDLANIKGTMAKISIYRDKLLYIDATIKTLNVKSRQLKEKASNLHKARVQYDAQAATVKQRNQEHDMTVAAKVVIPPSLITSSPTPNSPALDSGTSSPVVEYNQTPHVAIAEEASQIDSVSVASQSKENKKKKAKPKKREAIIDEGPIKRPISSSNITRGLRQPPSSQ